MSEMKNVAAALREYFETVTKMRTSYAEAEKACSQSVLEELRESHNRQFKNAIRKANDEIAAACDRILAEGEKAHADYLSLGDAEADYKMLSMPIKLSESDLLTMADKHPNNLLFRRTVAQYAEKQGYHHPGFLAMAAEKGKHEMAQEQVRTLKSTLGRYCQSET